MKNLLVIPVQSISDVVTNSSSEVFILNTPKSCEEVNNILSTFTSGFSYPEVFNLKEYREWRKNRRCSESNCDTWNYPGTIFEIANGWFKDPEDEEDLFTLRQDFLFDPFEVLDYGDGFIAHSFSGSYKEPIQDAFIEYLNANWDRVGDKINAVLTDMEEENVSSINWKVLRRNNYWLRDALEDETREFLNSYTGPKPTVWEVPRNEDVTRLDGCVLVVSEDDNSIPYETWDQIRNLFNGWNVHLG